MLTRNHHQLESRYRASPVVGNICVYADPNKAKPVAIIVPVEKELASIAKATGGVKGEHLEELVHGRDRSERREGRRIRDRWRMSVGGCLTARLDAARRRVFSPTRTCSECLP